MSRSLAGQHLRSPGAPPLTRRIELGRSMRPIGWQVNADGRWRIVENATAERIAITRLWVPVLEPEREPALDLVFIVDGDPRLRPWRELTTALIAVARSSGRGRNVTTWTIAGDELTPRLRAGGRGSARDPRHAIDPTGRSVVLVVSDFAGALWRDPKGLACLRLWARRMSTTLISLLPERLWQRTILGALAMGRVFARRPCQASTALASETVTDPAAARLPVITIDPVSVRAWAALVSGDVRTRLTSVAVLPDLSLESRILALARAVVRQLGRADPDGAELERQTGRIRQRLQAAARASAADDPVDHFHRSASPGVARLAAALVRAPLRLDVMRLVQRAIAPSTGPLELAEILGSGLFSPRPEGGLHERSVWFEIAPDVRARVAELAPMQDGVRVLEVVGRYVLEHLGGGYDFEALIVDPGREPGPVPEELRPFARIYVEELARLGGRYRELAPRLARAASIVEDEHGPEPGAAPADPAKHDLRPSSGETVTARARSGRTPRQRDVAQARPVELPTVRTTDFGLVIGLDHYPRFRSLRGAVTDATRFHAWLCDPEGGGLTREDARLLVSGPDPVSPTQDMVDQELLQLVRRAAAIGGSRRLYFYYSGHAVASNETETDIALLLPQWSRGLTRSALSVQGYIKALGAMGVFEELVFLIDGETSPNGSVVSLQSTIDPHSLATPASRERLASTRTFIAYATKNRRPAFEAATEDGDWQGVFTRCLLSILRGSRGITAADLKNALAYEVTSHGQVAHVVNGLRSEACFGTRGRLPLLVIRFSRARGHVSLRDGHRRLVAETEASATPWELFVEAGLYKLHDDASGATVVLEVGSERNEVTF